MSKADALLERLDKDFLQYPAADVVYAMAMLLGYSLARFHKHNVDDAQESMSAIADLIAIGAVEEIRRTKGAGAATRIP